MSIFAVGDIHGRLDCLNGLLASLPVSDDDTIVFLGDYVDRGQDSLGVIQRIMEVKKERGEQCVCLIGNHEDLMLDYFRRTHNKWDVSLELQINLMPVLSYSADSWASCGGGVTLASYPDGLDEAHISFLANCPLTWTSGDFHFVHAGLKPHGSTTRGEMLWGISGFWPPRDPFTNLPSSHGEPVPIPSRTVVVGHTVFSEPVVLPGKIGVDTGCAYGGKLTAIRLPEMDFHQYP